MSELNENADALAVQHYNLSLDFSRAGQFERAADELVQAAIILERDEDWRKIPALWRAAAATLAKVDPENLTDPTIKPDHFMNFGTVDMETWRGKNDLNHRIAWAYQWAAEHRLRADPASHLAHDLFIRSAYFAEKTDQVKQGHDFSWPFQLYERALVNLVAYRSVFDENDEMVQRVIAGLKRNAAALEKHVDKQMSYRLMIRAYRNLRVILSNTGNISQARSVGLEESKYLTRFFISSKEYDDAFLQSVKGHRFMFSCLFFVGLVLVVFPLLYVWLGSLMVDGEPSDIWSALEYSARTALIMGSDSMSVTSGMGKILTIFQTVISYFTLSVLVSRLIERTSIH